MPQAPLTAYRGLGDRKIVPWPLVGIIPARSPAVPLAAFIGRRDGLPPNVVPLRPRRPTRHSSPLPPVPPAAA